MKESMKDATEMTARERERERCRIHMEIEARARAAVYRVANGGAVTTEQQRKEVNDEKATD